MSQYIIPVQFHTRRDQVVGAGVGGRASLNESSVQILQDVSLNAVLRIPDIPEDAIIVRARIDSTVAGILETKLDLLNWSRIGVAAANSVRTDNGGTAALRASTGATIVLGGSALTALGAGLQTLEVEVEWFVGRGQIRGTGLAGLRNAEIFTQMVGLEFADTAAGDNPPNGDFRPMFRRIEGNVANAQNGRVVLASSGTQRIVVNSAALAYVSPVGAILLTAGDLGTAFGQIPTQQQLWLASQMRAHPSVFIRYPDRIRGILPATPVGDQNLEPLAGPDDPGFPSPVTIWTVDREPRYSTWELLIDGAFVEVTFTHPVGVDVRRPRDIYQRIVVPFFMRDGALGNALPGLVQVQRNTAAPPPDVFDFFERGGTLRSLEFLEYASLRSVWDADVSPILTQVAVQPA